MQCLTARLEDHQLGEHLVVFVLLLDRVGALQLGLERGDRTHHGEQLERRGVGNRVPDSHLAMNWERFHSQRGDQRADLVSLAGCRDLVYPLRVGRDARSSDFDGRLLNSGKDCGLRRVGEIGCGESVPCVREQVRILDQELCGLPLGGQQPIARTG
jgi:hypothetical protein